MGEDKVKNKDFWTFDEFKKILAAKIVKDKLTYNPAFILTKVEKLYQGGEFSSFDKVLDILFKDGNTFSICGKDIKGSLVISKAVFLPEENFPLGGVIVSAAK